jgi:uncharacterized protein (TIGR02594 family)
MTDLLLAMLADYGLKEVSGPKSNPELVAMAKDLGFDMEDDSTLAWCSLAMNYYAKKCGYEYTGKLDARSWLALPKPIVILKPTLGDIVVFWRESASSWKGHVALFVAQDLNLIYCLGGNQGNSLSISAYPRDQVLGYRQIRRKV